MQKPRKLRAAVPEQIAGRLSRDKSAEGHLSSEAKQAERVANSEEAIVGVQRDLSSRYRLRKIL
jgi:hypothetical protein